MKTKILALFIALWGLGTSGALAGEKIRVALFLAENTPPPPGAVMASEKMHERLHLVFGFKHYELVHADDIELSHEWEQWAVPRNDFFIRLEPLHHEPGAPRQVAYEIYKDGFSVAKGLYEPHLETPLFINGPDFKNGRLIFVLEAK